MLLMCFEHLIFGDMEVGGFSLHHKKIKLSRSQSK